MRNRCFFCTAFWLLLPSLCYFTINSLAADKKHNNCEASLYFQRLKAKQQLLESDRSPHKSPHKSSKNFIYPGDRIEARCSELQT
ncbi:hypothetical protein [Nostoc linckia]|uniref:hypothetical protein n=1 Tax=Nostoc linckia TaxID=92942 RepID=UPI00117CEE6E|nr:hypothetical protein [Nostoc linckia]